MARSASQTMAPRPMSRRRPFRSSHRAASPGSNISKAGHGRGREVQSSARRCIAVQFHCATRWRESKAWPDAHQAHYSVPRRDRWTRCERRGVRNLRDAGDPVELSAYYNSRGADELVFLDITASSDHREKYCPRYRAHRRSGLYPVDGRWRYPKRRGRSTHVCELVRTRRRSTPPRFSVP